MPGGSIEKKKKSLRTRRPPALLWWPAFLFVTLFFKLRYRVRIIKEVRRIKGPAVILSTHVSGKDHLIVGLGVFPERPNFVLSEHFMAIKKLRPVLRLINAIPKKMFCADGAAVIKIMRAVRDGRSVVLFPEGRLTWYSRSLGITDGTAELIKQLKVDVYASVIDGAGLSFPKWADKPRRGRIEVRISRLLDASQVREKSVSEIRETIAAALRHDDELSLPDVVFRAPKNAYAEGLEKILWICPSCGAEVTFETKGAGVSCPLCRMKATVDGHGRVTGDSSGIAGVAGWHEYCASEIDTSRPLSYACRVARTDGDGYMEKPAGENRGIFTVSRGEISFDGVIDGEKESFSIPSDVVKGFPVTVGEHVDLYYQNRLYYIYPDGPVYMPVKTAMYLEKAMRENAER